MTLPHSQFLDQSHIGTICTRVQLAANDCPAGSIYGYAEREDAAARRRTRRARSTWSPPTTNCPTCWPTCDGQVNVRLRGIISSAKARIKNVFYPVPDVPVSKFALTMKGGKKGLLVNSRDLCARAKAPAAQGQRRAGEQGAGAQGPARDRALQRPERQEAEHAAAAARLLRQEAQRRQEEQIASRVGAPDAFGPDRRLEQPRGAGADAARRCCPSWATGDELLIVDNASSDDTADRGAGDRAPGRDRRNRSQRRVRRRRQRRGPGGAGRLAAVPEPGCDARPRLPRRDPRPAERSGARGRASSPRHLGER